VKYIIGMFRSRSSYRRSRSPYRRSRSQSRSQSRPHSRSHSRSHNRSHNRLPNPRLNNLTSRSNIIAGHNFIPPITGKELQNICKKRKNQSFCAWLFGYPINYNGGKHTYKYRKSKSNTRKVK